MTSVTTMKCACDSCLCVVSLSEALEKGGKYYCSEACSNDHAGGVGCGHSGCGCGQK